MATSITFLAGPDALRLIQERGLHPDDVDIVPGASGGPRFLALSGVDRVLFGEFLRSRKRPLHLIGTSIGAWRLACLAQKNPVAALERLHQAYLQQRYPPKPSPALVREIFESILEALLGQEGEAEILHHPWARLHVLTSRCRGLLASENRYVQMAGFAVGAMGNLVSRRALGWQLDRVILHTAEDSSPFARLMDLPSFHLPLTRENLRAALLATASIPLVLQGTHIPGAPPGLYRDGGVTDYHLDIAYGSGQGLVLYPHFCPYVVPSWFDKSLRWRHTASANFRRALLMAPSPEFLARLPHGKIPDLDDFVRFSDEERLRYWRKVLSEGERMGDELRAVLASGRLAEHVQPL